MSKSSVQFCFSVPLEIMEAYLSCQNRKNLTSFVRIAMIEKLNRDFGFALDARLGDFSQGKRVDLNNPQKRARKKAALDAAAGRARAGRESRRREN